MSTVDLFNRELCVFIVGSSFFNAGFPNLEPDLIVVNATEDHYNIYFPPSNYSHCVSVPNTSYSCDSSHHLQVPKEVCSDVCVECKVQVWVNTTFGRGSAVEINLWRERGMIFFACSVELIVTV